MTIDQVVQAIAGMSGDELSEVVAAHNERRAILSRQAVRQFRAGDRVQFEGRHGRTLEGWVRKTNRKTINIETTDGMMWRVSPSLVSRCGGES